MQRFKKKRPRFPIQAPQGFASRFTSFRFTDNRQRFPIQALQGFASKFTSFRFTDNNLKKKEVLRTNATLEQALITVGPILMMRGF